MLFADLVCVFYPMTLCVMSHDPIGYSLGR